MDTLFRCTVSIIVSFCFLGNAWAAEPTDAFKKKVKAADIIIIAKPLKIIELERIPFKPSDFKFKTAVYDCKARTDRLEEFIPQQGGQATKEKKERKSSWVCCAEREKISIREEGKNLVQNTTVTSDCKTVSSPSSYLTGRFPKVSEVTLNGKKINEEQYMNFQSERLNRQGRARYIKKKVTVEVERILKGDASRKEISIEFEQGVRKDGERIVNSAYFFKEKNDGARVLFLRRIESGIYSLLIPQAGPSPTDVPILEGMVFAERDMQGPRSEEAFSENRVEVRQRSVPRRGMPREIKRVSLGDYIELIHQVLSSGE